MDKKLNLVILTSHRLDCFHICWKCLDEFTDLTVFNKIFILANAVEKVHLEFLMYLKTKYANVEVVLSYPRGLKAATAAQNRIYLENRGDVFIKLDEDVFVSEGWLNGLVAAYNKYFDTSVVLLSPLVPNNQIGKYVLTKLFDEKFPGEFTSEVRYGPVHSNKLYGEWVWARMLTTDLQSCIKNREHIQDNYVVDGLLNINCIMFDERLVDIVIPFKKWDEEEINAIFNISDCRGLMISSSFVHHYSFGQQQEYLDEKIGLESIYRHIFGLQDAERLYG